MKLICPNCQYTAEVDSALPAAEGEVASVNTCARCGEPMNQLLWNGFQPPNLTTATANAATAIAPQRIMENQNAYAPSAEASFDDVLEIPTPLRSAQPVTDQMLVLEDVIPAQDYWTDDEIPDSQIEFTDDGESSMSGRDGGHIHPAEASTLDADESRLAGPQVYSTSQTSSFDYEGGRAWLRIAPMLLLLGVLVFFALYYLGNRVGVRDRTTDSAATQAQPEPQSAAAAPAAAALPDNSQNASQSPSPAAESIAATGTEPAQPTAVALKEEAPKPAEKPVAETPKRESQPPAAVAAPAAVATAPAATTAAPVVDQSAGNFTVQVGSYNNAAQADERASRLRSSGIEARVVRADIPRRGTWYRVQAGRFASQTEAARYATELKGKGATDDFVVTSAQNQ
ncbi:MAG TPA: SPOR domain-containing protein [Pyrinomonadaceae bacterium]|jgi:cell division protein FtsN